jgi:dihydrolipoamide dehydrogenase
MAEQSYDITVIGGGVGGYTAALRAAGLGASVALVESGSIGGTCLNIGCIPTKALLESCRLARTAAKAGVFGVSLGEVGTLPQEMVNRSRSIVQTLTKGVEDQLKRAGVTIMKGTGRLVSSDTIEVEAQAEHITLAAKSIVIATGSSWISLPGIEIDGTRVITSDHALTLEHIPDDLVIVGGGAIGCEFAEIYSSLGARVTIIEMMPQILPTEDAELAKRLEAALKRKGIKVMIGSKVAGIDKDESGVRVRVEGGQTIEAGQVLMGIGRVPNVEGLGLEEAGVRLAGKSIETDDGMRTNVPGIFAVGDVTGKWLLAHVALAQGVVAGRNACGGSSVMDYTAVPRCVYTDPELAAVGFTEAEAEAEGIKVKIHRVRLGQVGRALTLGETFGLAKIIIEEGTGRIAGFHVLGPHASELLSEVSLAIRKGITINEVAEVIHPHPTLSELVWECADGAVREQGPSS